KGVDSAVDSPVVECVVGSERVVFLHHGVCYWSLDAFGAHELGYFPQYCLGWVAVCVVGLAGGEFVGVLQCPANHDVFPYGVCCGTACGVDGFAVVDLVATTRWDQYGV